MPRLAPTPVHNSDCPDTDNHLGHGGDNYPDDEDHGEDDEPEDGNPGEPYEDPPSDDGPGDHPDRDSEPDDDNEV